MPDCPFLSALSLLRFKTVLGTWIQIFSIISKPWEIAVVFVLKRRTNVKGMFFWSRLYPFFLGLCWYDWGGSRPWGSCCMSGVVKRAFQQRPWTVPESTVFKSALACEAFSHVYLLKANFLEAKTLTLKNSAARVFLVMKINNIFSYV